MSQSNQSILSSDVNISSKLPSGDSNSRNTTGYGKSPKTRPNRRSLSGAPLTCLFETKFQHLKVFQKTQNENRGLNSLLVPMSGALYRSSMPATPIATPSLFGHGIRFTEQALEERMKLKLHQSPRKAFIHSVFNEPALKEVSESRLDLTSAPLDMTTRLDGDQLSEPRTKKKQIKEDVTTDRSSDNIQSNKVDTVNDKSAAISGKLSGISTKLPKPNSSRSHKLHKERDH